MAKKPATITKALTKSQLYAEIAEATGLTKKQVGSVFESLTDIVNRSIKSKGAGTFTLPGLLKIKTVKKPKQPARKNVPNPFKPGELMDIPAKPATVKVKVLPLKALKEAALK